VQFSHKPHASLKLECVYCHERAETGERATLPSIRKCTTCHTSTREYAPRKPAYALPDFVFFSHGKHAAAGIECGFCHGDVWRQQMIQPVLKMKMEACVDCHKSRGGTVECNRCHELNQ
jgi:hypothetical protein